MSCEKRSSSVSKSEMEQPSEAVEEDAVHLDPHVQTYLSRMSQEAGCWGRFLPIPFERAASRSWWDPSFDSEILEEQFRKSAGPHNRLRFRYALWYIILLSTCWFLYFLITGLWNSSVHWPLICAILAAVGLSTITTLVVTYQDCFFRHMHLIALATAFFLCSLSLVFLILVPLHFRLKESADFSPVGHFSVCVEILLLVYTVIPLKLYMCTVLGIVYSVIFELLTWLVHDENYEMSTIVVRVLLHLCIHVIGLHILVMTNARMRNTFMKVGQSLLVGQQLKAEKNLKESMLHSLMPPKVAKWLLQEEDFTKNGKDARNSTANDIQSIFRPFNMNRIENVSILFADIVGFTRMASTKTAEELVDILNKLFQKFDALCKQNHCEKIATLGDCYYCVSGCPEPRADHARCCVEMGLGVVQVIKQFDEEHHEGVNMRVGVHTGTILCGIVGTRRFKFDVWSNDVTLANRMESTGKPGMVHVSEKTVEYLQDMYLLEEGEQLFGMKTYFILGRKNGRLSSCSGSFKAIERNSLQLIVSPPSTPPSASPQTRPRVLSCDNSHIKVAHNPNMLSPDVCKIKASSLPSILDEQEIEEKDSGEGSENAKTPTSTASSGRYSVKIRNWKIATFLKKTEPAKDEAVPVETLTVDEQITATLGGYHPVPTIIEAKNLHVNGAKLTPQAKRKESSTVVHERNDSIYSDDLKEGIDVKSYISQSRSDIGQYEFTATDFTSFMRSGSYKSPFTRSPNEYSILNRVGSYRSRRGRSPNFDIIPVERSRSATVAVGTLERPKKSLDVPRLSSIFVDDQLSVGYSLNSRKDSGIKSNSRRSSIQQLDNQIPPVDTPQQRLSGYYTCSQASLTPPPYDLRPSHLFFDKCGPGLNNIRKQSDLQLIKCVQKNSESEQSYFMKPPLSKVTLFFENAQMEREYRENAHFIVDPETIPTLSNSRFNTYFDILVSCIVFFIVAFCLFLLYEVTTTWLVTFVVFSLMQMCVVGLCIKRIVNVLERVCNCCSRWYRWNGFGAAIVSLPLLSVLCNFACTRVFSHANMSDYLYSYLLFVGVVHFCNFTQLNCWMKNCLATIFGVVFISLILSGYDSCANGTLHLLLPADNLTSNWTAINETLDVDPDVVHYLYDCEILIDFLLLLALVWFLNREFEIGYRLSFHANYVANHDKIHVQQLKNQADWLIYNIVPEHVADQLKKEAKYSENFKDVGVLFASIVNFNEMYDETYLGGKEFLRVLNELIGDFDELLTWPQFKCVEKIKTIGSTFFAASGLNSRMRLEQEDPHEHLFALMEFAIAMQKVIDDFNRDLLEFNLILRIGYNFGEVTAAVIGNTKLYYDIWGDTVNVSSRMDTTGVNGRIQVGEHCLGVLEERYVFEPRGPVFIKGKDDMKVYLLLGKKSEMGDAL